MTEQHECEWTYAPDWKGGNTFACIYPDCENKLNYNQASRRLNEYETLKKATDVLSVDDCHEMMVLGWTKGSRDKLRAYADILEDK